MNASQQLPGVAELVSQFSRFRYSVFRLETLQEYSGSDEDEAIAAFRRGDVQRPPDRAEDEWVSMLRGHREAGRVQQRVHVVTEPLSDYLEYELTWEYGPHQAAGEDIRILLVEHGWPADIPVGDFWLFDSRTLFTLHYDSEGAWRGVTRVSDAAAIVDANVVRDAALCHSIPWADYMRQHPNLLSRVPGRT